MMCNVSDKMPCIFETRVDEGVESSKRAGQNYRVVACADNVRPDAAKVLESCVATEKIDGTCCIVKMFDGKPWLWARHDLRPKKSAAKRPIAEKDYKEPPPNWTPARSKIPGENGHIFGWVPVDPTARTHCWHLAAVDLNASTARVFGSDARVTDVPLIDLNECTMELIGTNVNGNPYKLGSKNEPVHFLVRHGSIEVEHLSFPEGIREWFETEEGQVEGIVWHCRADGRTMYKLHRHHLGLPWPVERPKLRLT